LQGKPLTMLTEALHDTIVAISTPPGRGGIGIVRLSGPRALSIAAEMLRLPQSAAALADPAHHAHARRAQLLELSHAQLLERHRALDAREAATDEAGPSETGPSDAAAGESASPNSLGDASPVLDDVLVTAFHAPRSYTTDDLVEIAAHGSPVVLDTALRTALALGARLAEPGEFTQRAFFAGRLDLAQAEAVHDLIAARTLDQVRIAAQQMGGALARQVAPAKESLLHIIALLEAGMDFASGELDDVDVVPPEQIAAAIDRAKTPLTLLAAGFRRGQLLREGAALAIVGRPNAGKSSLFNRMLERERAIVTPLAGTTRDTVEESLELGGMPLRLIDTAGLRSVAAPAPSLATALTTTLPQPGEAEFPAHLPAESPAHSVSQTEHAAQLALSEAEQLAYRMADEPAPVAPLDEAEAQGIARSREALADADLVLFVHDATHPLDDEEAALLRSLDGRPHLVAWNKIDLVDETGAAEDAAVAENVVRTSARTGAGLVGLRAAILRSLDAEGSVASTALVNNLRQQQHVLEAIAALDAAATLNTDRLPHEVLLLELHTALRALDALTGATTTDDILARIFSTFCIGK
jgi:tRNA modification GTPase